MRHKKVSQDKWLACHTLLLFGVTLLLVLQSLISAPSKWPGEKPSQEGAEESFRLLPREERTKRSPVVPSKALLVLPFARTIMP